MKTRILKSLALQDWAIRQRMMRLRLAKSPETKPKMQIRLAK
jgi:hypothetical protein